MNSSGVLQAVVFFAVLLALAWPLGRYMAGVFQGRIPAGMRWQQSIERVLYRLAGVREDDDMPWPHYAAAVLVFGALGVLLLYVLQRVQAWLPLNPMQQPAVSPDLAFNTAVSFVSNTNWQSYAGETTMAYATQILGLTVQNFLSAATGMAVAVALIRAFTRKLASGIGNFWVDMVRAVLYVLLPLSVVLALALVSQGVVQTWQPAVQAAVVQPDTATAGADAATQTIALGPAASQVAIKHLGTNGGGFFNANSAHPLENPTPLSNMLEMLALMLIPTALCFTFGHMVHAQRQGLALLAAMACVLLVMLTVVWWAEQSGNPLLARLGVDIQASDLHPGGNMEGKELRFGISASVLFVAITTAVACGAVNSMHDPLMPLGGLVAMWLIQLGEVVFGGAGSGLYGMLVFAMLAVFVAGLMIGRTPEYLGKKIGAFEIKMASVAILATPLAALLGTAVSVMLPAGRAAISNPGAHGLSQVLYAFSSAANNNGSAFGGLNANTPYYNTALGLAMLWGRYAIMVAVLALAGSLAGKKVVPPSAGTLPTHGGLFIFLLIVVVVVVGALTFLPALALGPLVEQLQMVMGAR
ncbi:MAG: potassium-transporting ATPase subunit KdpA [Brachymonas sp.]|nr:potassium-transporting ATPase subunit KdpA [Brachymonas sp.]